MEFEKCREILLREHEAVAMAASMQKLMENAVHKRDWAEFEAQMEALNNCGISLAEMEKEREALFGGFFDSAENLNYAQSGQKQAIVNELIGTHKSRFYSLCMHFSPSERGELGEIYRSLKFETLKLRIANETFLEYLNEMRFTMAGIVNLAFPELGGKMYTPRGVPASQDMRSMVLNQKM